MASPDLRLGLAFETVLARHYRVVVTGRPGVGKTSLVNLITYYTRPIFSTDGLAGVPWDDQPRWLIGLVAHQSAYLMEGITAARCLRKGLKPDAVFVLLGEDRTGSTDGRRRALGERVYKWVDEASKMPEHKDTKFYYYDTRTGETNV